MEYSIRVCPYGGVHLVFGQTSVHLDHEQFQQFSRTTAHVAEALLATDQETKNPELTVIT